MSELAKLSDFREYPHGLVPVILWRVSNESSPCTSNRTEETRYYDPELEIYYNNPDKTSKVNGMFFPEDSTYEMYFEIVNGKQQYDETYTCNITSVKYDDMPHPESISVHNQYLLAAYPHYQVVVKYDLRQGTNPTGQVVAGSWGRSKKGPNESNQYLNFPEMVKWRDDGERFAVYSGGNMKSISFYDKNGALLRNLQSQVWGGTGYGMIPTEMRYNYENGYAIDANIEHSEDQSFIKDLTPDRNSDRIDNIHVVTRLEYVSNGTHWAGTHDVEYEALYVGMYYRDNNNAHSYKLWAFVPFSAEDLSHSPFHVHNFAKLTYPSGGDLINRDLISDFAVVRKQSNLQEFTNYIYLAHPIGSGNNNAHTQQQNYTAREYTYNYKFTGHTGIPSVRVLGQRTINHGANQNHLYYGKHVRAEVEYRNNELFVIITSSEKSTAIDKKLIGALGWILVGGTAVGTGVPMGIWLVNSVAIIAKPGTLLGVTGWVKSASLASVVGESLMAVIGTIAAAVAIVAAAVAIVYMVYKMFRRRVEYAMTELGISKSTVSGSMGSLNYTESSTTGLYGNDVDWIPNDGMKINNLTIDKAESSARLYAIQLDGSIRKGTWTSNSSTLVLKEVKE